MNGQQTILSENDHVRETVALDNHRLIFRRYVRGKDGWREDHCFSLCPTATTRAREMAVEVMVPVPGILRELLGERLRQAAMFPEEEHGLPDGTGVQGYKTMAEIARNACDRAAREHRLTTAHVFEEETYEVLAEDDPVKLRKELVQVGAVVTKWIAEIDRREAAKRMTAALNLVP